MTLSAEIKKPYNRIYVDAYLKRRYPDGSYDSDWIDITRHCATSSLGTMDFDLDSGDYDVGIFAASNMTITFNNQSGKFSDVLDSRSYWASLETRHLSLIKIEAGYLDNDGVKYAATPFTGLLDENSVRITSSDTVRITLLSRESIFKRVTVVPGSLSSASTVNSAILVLCDRTAITDIVGVSAGNINAGNNITMDSCNEFDGRKLDIVLNEILLLSNSVMYIDDSGDMIVRDRDHTATIQHRFYSNSESGKRSNIYDVANYSSGRHRVKNYWAWSGGTEIEDSESYMLTRYGTTRKSISSEAVTGTATRSAILANQLATWQWPKRELTLVTDYMPGQLEFYDLVTLDMRPYLPRDDDLPVAGVAVAGTATSVDYTSGLFIPESVGWKVLGYSHDLRRATTTIKLREVGTTLTDSYIATEAPAAPTLLTATADGSTVIDLAWTDNASTEHGFKVERSTDGIAYSVIDTISGDSTAYQDTGRTAATQYYYRVRAYTGALYSDYTNADDDTTAALPVAPSSLTATAISKVRIDLAWSDDSSDESGFSIERSLNGVDYAEVTTVAAGEESYSNTGLTASTQYWYKARAYRANGSSTDYSEYSAAADDTTLGSSVLEDTSNMDIAHMGNPFVEGQGGITGDDATLEAMDIAHMGNPFIRTGNLT